MLQSAAHFLFEPINCYHDRITIAQKYYTTNESMERADGGELVGLWTHYNHLTHQRR